MLQRWHSLLTGLCFLLASLGLQAQVRVVVVSSDSGAAYVDTTQSLLKVLETEGLTRYVVKQIRVAELTEQLAQEQLANAGLFVALGADASMALARFDSKVPVLSTLLPRASFMRILAQSGRRVSPQFSALYLDQPLARQLALLRLVLPYAQRLCVLWGPDSVQKAPAMRQLTGQLGWNLQEAQISTDGQIYSALKQVLAESDVFLALADPLVFNPGSLQNIMLSSFRAKVPIVAFSPAYVRAGALLSLHTSASQTGTQAGRLVRDWLSGAALPSQAVEPAEFEISINQHVARSCNLALDEKVLQQALRRLERLP
jgi:ABC-type uncharacterized transport system substrate-binding protein